MSKYIKGILGAVSGLVGTVVGASYNGIDYLRSRPKKSTKPKTEAQLEQQMVFELVGNFIRQNLDEIRVGFQTKKKGQSAYSAAMGENLKEGTTGVYPALMLNYSKLVMSKGGLKKPSNVEVSATDPGELVFDWINNARPGTPSLTDKATLIVYNPLKEEFVTMPAAAARTAETYMLQVPSDFSGDVVHTWLYFVTTNGKSVSDSVYVGTATVV